MKIKNKVFAMSRCHFAIIHCQKLCKNCILKYLIKIFFLFFKQFSSIGGLGATIADFGTRGPVFKSWPLLFFFLVKMWISTGLELGAFKFKVSYAYPYTTETEVLMQKKFLI